MIKDILYPLNNQLTGPIPKPLIANNNDYMGNSLSVDAQIFNASTHYTHISESLGFSFVQSLSSDFPFDGETFTATAILTIFDPTGDTYVKVTATGIGNAVDASSSGQKSVMGIKYEGSGPTVEYQGVNSWTKSGTNSMNLILASGASSLPSWVSGGNAWGTAGANTLSDTLTITLLSVA